MSPLVAFLRRFREALGEAEIVVPLPGGSLTLRPGVEVHARPEPRIVRGHLACDPGRFGPGGRA